MKTYQIFFVGIVFMILQCTGNTYAQKSKPMPLFDFLQNTADSTVILSHIQNIYLYPEYFIVSKKGDTINMYSYRYTPPIDVYLGVDIPKAMAKKIATENLAAASMAPDVNLFFEVKVVKRDTLNMLWNDLRKLNLWNITDDKADGPGCPIIPGKPTSEIYDAGGPLFKLITKNTVKDLRFYAPSYYEKECPGRAGRIAALKIEKIFKDYFTAAGEKYFGEIRKHRFMFKNSMY